MLNFFGHAIIKAERVKCHTLLRKLPRCKTNIRLLVCFIMMNSHKFLLQHIFYSPFFLYPNVSACINLERNLSLKCISQRRPFLVYELKYQCSDCFCLGEIQHRKQQRQKKLRIERKREQKTLSSGSSAFSYIPARSACK